jgi:opacity protein-like surface antigen
MNHRTFLALSACILFVSKTAPAQWTGSYSEQKWEVSFFGGVNFGNEQESLTPIDGKESGMLVTRDAASGFLIGARVTENRGAHFSAELDYTYANQPLGFLNLNSELPRLDLSHQVHTAVYSVLYNFTPGTARFRPYASVGIGASFFRIGGDSKLEAELLQGIELKDRWKFAGAWGGGLKVRLGEHWGVRFDARDVVTGIPDYGLPHTAPSSEGGVGVGFRPDGFLHNWQVSTGVMILLDGI